MPRRAFLGVDVDGRPRARGVLASRVVDGGPAACAGVREGDVLVGVGERAIAEPGDVVEALRGVAPGTAVALRTERDGKPMVLDARAGELPVERIGGADVRLGHVRCGAHRLRTVVTVPTGEGGRFPAVLYLQGIETASCEHPFEPEHSRVRLVEAFSRAGCVTMRVERSGVGDSEGPPPEATDLDAEIEGARAALRALAELACVDAHGIFVFGHSLGGMVAPLVARGVAGVVVFGASALRWRECIIRTTERQLRLAGYVGDDLADRTAMWAELHALVCRDGLTPAEVLASRPHLARLESRECRGETLFGRHVDFFRQLQATDLTAACRLLAAPVLALHGEYDWVVGADESRAIAEAARGSYAELPRIGHDLRAHASLDDSFRRPTSGAWDGSVADAVVAWLRQTRTVAHPSGKTQP